MLFLLLISLVCPTAAYPLNTQHSTLNKFVVIVANRLVLSDLENQSLRNLAWLMRGSVGLVSPSCAGPRSESSILLTAGAGANCRGGAFVAECYDADEVLPSGLTARDEHALRTGYKARPGSAVFLGLSQALRANAETGCPARIGALGDALHRAGIRTCAIGNADILPDTIDRSAAVLAADSRGIIDIGHLCAAQNAASSDFGFMVVDFGASERLDECKISISDAAYSVQKASMMRALDRLVGELRVSPESSRAALILVSFSPPSSEYWNQLTPIVIRVPGESGGLLTSPTTRTVGLIAASDFAPTVLRLLGVRLPAEMVGRAAHRAEHSVIGTGPLREMEVRVTANHTLILPILWVFAAIGAVSFTVASIILAFSLRASHRLIVALRVSMLFGASAPLAMLLAVLAPTGEVGYAVGTFAAVAVLVGVGLAVGRAARREPRPPDCRPYAVPVLIMFGLTAAAVMVDSITGGYLCKFALPSSYQLSGLRFYGIGNEYSGVLVVMSALVCLFAFGRMRAGMWAALALSVVLVFILGAGNLGANYGDTAAAVVTLGLVCMSIRRGGFCARHVAVLLAVGIVMVAALAYLDLLIAGASGSHGARAAGFAETFGQGYVLSLVARKTMLNLDIAVSRQAVRAYIVFVPFLALWFYGIQGKVKLLFAEEKHVLAGLKGIVIGAAAALVLNDSGIVIASIMIAMTVLILLYSLLEARECRES